MDSLYQTIAILEELLAEIKELEAGTVEELIKKKIDALKKEEIIRLEAESNMLKFKGKMANYDVKMINRRSNCMLCGKPLTEDEGMFFCKECEKGESK